MTPERGNKHDSVLRRFERQVLDAHHRSLPLLRRPPGVALYGLMAAYDSSLLPIAAVTPHITPEAIGSMQRLKYIYESVNPATRWIVSGNLIPDPVLAPNRALIEEGGELLSYARDYVQVAIFHVMYGHDLVTAETDENKRVVRFIPPDGSSFPYGFAESTLGQMANDTRDAERAEAVKAAKPLIEGLPYSLDRGHIRLDGRELLSPQVNALVESIIPREPVELSDEANLSGFTMWQLRAFWRGLLGWSAVCSGLYLSLATGGVPQEECMPTQVIPRAEFHERMQMLSGLDPDTVARIVDRLSYDWQSPKSELLLQPLLTSRNFVSWCPLAVQISKYERNALKVMSRAEALRDAAATLIGSREKLMLNQVGLLLAKKGKFDFKLNRTLRHEDQRAELDLLAYNRKAPSELLLIEAKAVLAVDDVGEVVAATKEFKKAQGQLRRAEALLRAMPAAQKRDIYPFVDWGRAETFRLLVVTPDSNAQAEFDHSEIPLITLELMQTQLRYRDYKSPTAVWEACKRKAWMEPLTLTGADFYKEIKIGSVTYGIPLRRDAP
jgi:hypothetical protein